MIKVKGYRVLVKPEKVERVSKGGIITHIEGTRESKLEDAAQQFGTVVGVGDTCWMGDAFKGPWCKEGDLILYSRHAGRKVFDVDASEDEYYFIMNDTDVLAVIEGDGSDG